MKRKLAVHLPLVDRPMETYPYVARDRTFVRPVELDCDWGVAKITCHTE